MKQLSILSVLSLSLATFSTANAEQAYCESSWLVEGKKLQVTVPTQGVDVVLTIAGVQKSDAMNCSATLQVSGQAPITQLGLVVAAQGNLQLKVQANHSSLSGTIVSPGPGGMWMQNKVNLSLNGYFLKPANQVEVGKTIPARQISGHSQGDLFLAQGLPKVGSASVDNLKVQLKSAQVGDLQTIPTSQGALQCHAVNYQANVSSGSMSNTIDKRNKQLANSKWVDLTDWYCPNPGITLKTVINEGKNHYAVNIKLLN